MDRAIAKHVQEMSVYFELDRAGLLWSEDSLGSMQELFRLVVDASKRN